MKKDLQPEPVILHIGEVSGDQLRLDRCLTEQLSDLSRSKVQALIREGRVEVNGEVATAKRKVREGDVVAIDFKQERSSGELEPEDVPLEILFEDESMIVVNKAEGMCVHPGAGIDQGTLVHALLHHCQGRLSSVGEEDRPGIVHRLDKDTSGCLVAAKSDEAHEQLAQSFFERSVKKIYACVVQGDVKGESGSLRQPISRNPGNRKKMAL
ncbi:MAG: RluA family pseudouridine synthase, partial [Verrucomicrobiota bacterium]